MPFDPTLPANKAELVSAVIRSQLNGLFDLTQAGSGLVSAQIDSVTTGNPGAVSSGTVASAISGTRNHSNRVATLDTIPSDPPSFANYEALRAKVNELIRALRR